MKMYMEGKWVDRERKFEVLNPFDGSVVDTVPEASEEDVERAIASAERGFAAMSELTAYDRYRLLLRAANLIAERSAELGRTITMEEGKTLREGCMEASRSSETMTLSAEEAKRIRGETVPLDAASNGAGKFGFTLRVPCGVVVAITPFNYPLNLVCHKVGPALAAGNAILIKPASDTPLSALKLTEILLEAGFPPESIQCLTGGGGALGARLCRDPRVRKISFTGSRKVGEIICRTAGLKRVTMELGSNSPLIIMDDADPENVARATLVTGYTNAGQVCITTQRVFAKKSIYGDFIDALRPKVESLLTGDPLAEEVKMGPMVREGDADRVHRWVNEAVGEGAQLIAGGEREGAIHAPTLLAEVNPEMRVSREEVFGPVVSVSAFDDLDEAIALTNQSPYGLSAALFTENINRALEFVQKVNYGNLHVNWGTMWRADLMPYGGLKESGMGKEGPHWAIEEMTELKMVVIH